MDEKTKSSETGLVAVQPPGANELATAGAAAHAEALVKARFAIAVSRPRDIEQARAAILRACARPTFAKAALYAKPVGRDRDTGEDKYIEGPSIRMAEEFARHMGNLAMDQETTYEDRDKLKVKVSACDLEANIVWDKEFTVEKTVERSYLRTGQIARGQRTNSYGKQVYLVEATEDDLAKKIGAAASKALRDCILRLVPSDIREDAVMAVKKTQADEDAKDPQAAKRAVIDAFSSIGVMPDALQEFIGHSFDTLSPAELQRLRGIYTAIRDDGETWVGIMQHKRDNDRERDEARRAGSGAPQQSTLSGLAAQSRARRGAAAVEKENTGRQPGEDDDAQ